MGDVVSFPGRKGSGKGSTLCREGHHQWKVDKARRFDVKRGKLVTVYRCQRCGKEKITTH